MLLEYKLTLNQLPNYDNLNYHNGLTYYNINVHILYQAFLSVLSNIYCIFLQQILRYLPKSPITASLKDILLTFKNHLHAYICTLSIEGIVDRPHMSEPYSNIHTKQEAISTVQFWFS